MISSRLNTETILSLSATGHVAYSAVLKLSFSLGYTKPRKTSSWHAEGWTNIAHTVDEIYKRL